jgi:acetolactate synthase I/II/III large subunit
MTAAADIIAQRLHQAGCRHAFGIPGGEVLTIMKALDAAGIAFHLVKHENAGGFMAEGNHHAALSRPRAPGILLATVGPGVVNAINTIANAWQDQVPLIFLTGCVDAADTHHFTHQVFDHTSVLAPITKASFTVEAGAVDIIIDKAVAIAIGGRPGPVHLDIPISVAKCLQDTPPMPPAARPAPMAPAPGPDFNAARDALANAERPLMIAGVDVLHHDAANQVVDTVRHLGIPLLTTYKAKGVLPENDPLALGGHGLSPKSFSIVKPLVDAADVIVLAGYDPIEMRADWINPWTPGNVGDDRPVVIDLSAEPNTHYVHQATHAFVGDVGAGLTALSAGLSPKVTWPGGGPAQVRASLAEAFPTNEDWGPAAVIDVARHVLPDDGVITVDTGAHRILLSQQWQAYAPRQILQSSGLCTMGVALPLAIGHKITAPQTPVLAFTGDAGLEMILGELATARDLKLAVPVIVFVDEQLALIELKQRRDQLPSLGVDFGGTDFAAVATAMGGNGITVRDRESLKVALEDALAADTFSVIACPIGQQPYNGRF